MGDNIVIGQLTDQIDPSFEQIHLDPAPQTLDEASRRLPSGGYTTFRTFGKTRVLRLSEHFERMEETARLAGHPQAVDRSQICRALRQALLEFPAPEARVRLSMDLERQVGTLFFAIEPLHVPSQNDYACGVRVVTRTMHRQNPKAKLTGFIELASSIRKDLPQGIHEAVMIGEDERILEGTGSNVFVIKKGVIWTAEADVLSGITRGMVLDEIREQNIPLILEGLPLAEIEQIDEAFITSASRAVLPVVEVDGKPVGDGRPGPITQRLLEGYLRRLDSELEDL